MNIQTEEIRKVKLIRESRERLCFPIINRGKLWYDRLTSEQLGELEAWYQAWLDAPDTGVIPKTPIWVNNKTHYEEETFL